MSKLHTVNKSPFENRSLESCLAHVSDGSALLLIEDGVFGALRGTPFETKVSGATKKLSVYVLGPDLEARGMQAQNVLDGVKVVDYAGFVDLAVQHDCVQSWL